MKSYQLMWNQGIGFYSCYSLSVRFDFVFIVLLPDGKTSIDETDMDTQTVEYSKKQKEEKMETKEGDGRAFHNGPNWASQKPDIRSRDSTWPQAVLSAAHRPRVKHL